MMKVGLEREMFLLDKEGNPVVIPLNIPSDECGVLVEARGPPADNITDAVYLLKAEEHRIERNINKRHPNRYTLDDSPIMEIPRLTRLKANRVYAKGLTTYQNIYGFEHHRNKITEQPAGIHISFTNPKEVKVNTCKECGRSSEVTVNQVFDYISLFTLLDKAFKDEIKRAKRRQGFYELKDDGRIEYRSLPSNVDLLKVIEVLHTPLNKL